MANPTTTNSSVARTASALLPTRYGIFQLTIYKTETLPEVAVLTMGDTYKQPALTRIHSQCVTGDIFSSLRCDCEAQLHKSLEKITKAGAGILIYLNQEGRGIGLTNKIKAYALQDQGYDTVEANHALGFPTDLRDYKAAADILKYLGITKINLLTNNPDKIAQITKDGITVVKRIPVEISPNTFNKKYLATKLVKLKHQLNNKLLKNS